MTIFIGVGIYVGFVRGYLRKKDGEESFYVNPSLSWFNLERNIYAPILQVTFSSTSAVFHVLDQGVVNFVHYIRNHVKAFSGMKIKRNYEHYNRANGDICIVGNNDDVHSLKEIMGKLSKNMNSLMYSVFIVATILAVMLVVLVL
jgi:hydrogenase-4 component B